MSYDADGFAPVDGPASQADGTPAHSGPPPGYGPPAYPPPGYGPPNYPPLGYGPPHYPPPGYGPPAYLAPVPQPLRPGIIPLRPLTLSEIFNGAVAYIRLNPKATLGFTAIVILTAQVLGLALQIGPLAALGELKASNFSSFRSGAEGSDPALLSVSLSSLAGAVTTGLAAIVLSGLLTVIVGQAVFGAKITVAQAWQRARPRLLALFGVTALEALGAALLVALATGLVVVSAVAAGAVAAVLVAVVVVPVLVVLLAYLGTMLSFAPTVIVLERLAIGPSLVRSFQLVRHGFWRVFGIRLLGVLVAGIISAAVSAPFNIAGQVLLFLEKSTAFVVLALVLIAIGGAIGQIITAPFNAGVVVLLYTDRRMRAEAFDLVLQTGATAQSHPSTDATDQLWLTAQSG